MPTLVTPTCAVELLGCQTPTQHLTLAIVVARAHVAMTFHFLQSLVNIFSAYFNEGKKKFNEVTAHPAKVALTGSGRSPRPATNHQTATPAPSPSPEQCLLLCGQLSTFVVAHWLAPQERIRDNFTLVYELLDGP